MKNKITYFLTLSFFLMIFWSSSPIASVNGAEEPKTSSYNNTNWHDGVETSTDEVIIKYEVSYALNENFNIEALSQKMSLSYQDGTNAEMGIELLHWFEIGGLDIAGQKVLDWNKAIKCEVTFFTISYDENGYTIQGRHVIQGFDIYNGTKANFGYFNASIDTLETPNAWDMYSSGANGATEPLAHMRYGEGNITIGEVSLSTRDYTYNGTGYKESRAEFNINLDAVVGTNNNNITMPAIISYELVHNVTHNKYKYGIYMNWSTNKDFNTYLPMNHGDDYFLVAKDLLECFYGGSNGSNSQLKQYYTDASGLNKTTVYKDLDDNVILTQYLHQTYNVVNSSGSTEHDTVRYYFYEGRYEGDILNQYGSNMMIFHEGFKWNESTGMYFDPTVIVPLALYSGQEGLRNIPGYDLFILIGVIIGFTGIVSVMKKKRMRLRDNKN
ncbi:hypothetical protein LCGC14_0940510 [marine sediment metagenome]|uniref:Uncharacterized protein n=1 Tax=marine sediment metagenome TaxID=412755 RepID=A0A0F9P6D2_9ZZZZ|nr:MAG: hypothetical protein Lokiarch_46120 [Candidatus Lokiarchaeum sp. GC14_75]HEC40767.1 hypothetical protein [bacterium]